MALGLGWKVKEGTLGPDDVVAPHERLDWGRTVGLGAQHVVAMFGATFLVPVLGVFWGWLFLDEAVTAAMLAGAALVLGALSLVLRR